jgi:hypothetical protein
MGMGIPGSPRPRLIEVGRRRSNSRRIGEGWIIRARFEGTCVLPTSASSASEIDHRRREGVSTTTTKVLEDNAFELLARLSF